MCSSRKLPLGLEKYYTFQVKKVMGHYSLILWQYSYLQCVAVSFCFITNHPKIYCQKFDPKYTDLNTSHCFILQFGGLAIWDGQLWRSSGSSWYHSCVCISYRSRSAKLCFWGSPGYWLEWWPWLRHMSHCPLGYTEFGPVGVGLGTNRAQKHLKAQTQNLLLFF